MIERLLARLIIVGDLRQPLVGGFFRQRLDGERACLQIIEQRFQMVVEQRQPMLGAGRPAAFAHRLVEHVVGRGGAESRHIAGAEPPDRFRRELKLRHGHEVERAQLVGRALGVRIEAANRFQRVAEEIEPDRRVHAGGEQIEDTAAHRIIARLAYGRGAVEAVELEPLGNARHRQQMAGRGRQRLPGQRRARRHPLQRGVDGGEHYGRAFAALYVRQPRQHGHALRHHGGVRRHAVVGQAIPGREFQHLDVGREEGERAGERRHARAVAADHGEADRGRRRRGGDRAGEVGEHQPFGAVGDAGEKERPAGRKPLGRRARRRS